MDDGLIERLRKVAPEWRQGQSNECALFDMANLNLWELNALINAAADTLQSLQSEIASLRGALEPFALLADGANMNDPLSKWFTVAQLKEADAALTVNTA